MSPQGQEGEGLRRFKLNQALLVEGAPGEKGKEQVWPLTSSPEASSGFRPAIQMRRQPRQVRHQLPTTQPHNHTTGEEWS